MFISKGKNHVGLGASTAPITIKLEQFKVFSVFCEVVKNCPSQFCRWVKKGNLAIFCVSET